MEQRENRKALLWMKICNGTNESGNSINKDIQACNFTFILPSSERLLISPPQVPSPYEHYKVKSGLVTSVYIIIIVITVHSNKKHVFSNTHPTNLTHVPT